MIDLPFEIDVDKLNEQLRLTLPIAILLSGLKHIHPNLMLHPEPLWKDLMDALERWEMSR
jgi:hypothetical protein